MKILLSVLLAGVLMASAVPVFASGETDKTDVKQPLVGVIRWDAYGATNEKSKLSVPDQVARTLSYYYGQAPYYAVKRETPDGDITLAFENLYEKTGLTYTLDSVKKLDLSPETVKYTYGVSWEEEAVLALDAGVDYFATVFYNDGDIMALPRKAHVATNGMVPDGRQMGLVWILEHGRLGTDSKFAQKDTEEKQFRAIPLDRRQLYQGMAQSCYVCLPGETRVPVLMCMHANQYSAEELAFMKAEALFCTAYYEKINPEKYKHADDVYFIGMQCEVMTEKNVAAYKGTGFTALSRYSSWPDFTEGDEEPMTRYLYNDIIRKNGEEITVISRPYTDLIKVDQKYNHSYLPHMGKTAFIPLVSLGLSHVPRIKTGVKWTGDYGRRYYRVGTVEERAQNVAAIRKMVMDYPALNPLHTMLIYAWNEHDEGGYLCPTIKVDETGQPLYNTDGSFQKDTSLIDAVRDVLTAQTDATPAPTNGPDVTQAPASPDAPNAKAGCGSAVSMAAILPAAVGSAVLLKKKKEN